MVNEKYNPGNENARRPGRCARFFVLGSLLVVILGVVIMIIPNPITPVAYDMLEPPKLSGALTPNDKLQQVIKITNDASGPESIVVHEDHIYTGTLDGKILKIDRSGQTSVLTRLGDNCTTMETCGRPLGMRMDPDNQFLVVADSYLGLFKIDPTTGKREKVFPLKNEYKVTFFDDFDYISDDEIVLSELDLQHHFAEVAYPIIAAGDNGCLLLINMKTGEFEMIRKGLFGANGVQRDLKDSNQESVLVAETFRNRIMRVFVKGPRRGQTEIFAENLPGSPDNIRATEAGDGYWVAFTFVRSQDYDNHYHALRNWPFVRLLLAKLLPFWTFKLLNNHYGLVVKLDLDGNIVSSLHDQNGNVMPSASEVKEHAGSLFFGNVALPGVHILEENCKERNNCFFRKEPEGNE